MMLSQSDYEKLVEYVYRKTGIALTEKHYEKVAKNVAQRCEALGLKDFRGYFFKLRFEDRGGDEFQTLINALTVNETYFFREKYQFEALVEYILPELDRLRPANRVLRILSSPCSTGDEPFSIAIYLLEEGNIVNRRDIEIVGIDIDTMVLEKARQGKYSERSIHAIPKDLVAKYFTKRGLYYEIDPEIRDAVHFENVNVFDKQAMRRLGMFDVIFSRNMLIYFDDASRKEVAMTYYEMLNAGGYVLLGHSEYMSRIVSVFTPKKFGEAIVYQK
ncbi:MAG: protein-glutamate O-methyltransferase CheR [Campylobacterales bacterium]